MEHTLAGFHRAKEGVFVASVKEAKVLMAEMHSNGSLAVLAPVNPNERGTEISVLVVCRAGSASCVSLETFSYSTRALHHREEV